MFSIAKEDFILIAFKRMNPRGNLRFRKRDQELDIDSSNTTDTSETESDDGTYEYEQELFDLGMYVSVSKHISNTLVVS